MQLVQICKDSIYFYKNHNCYMKVEYYDNRPVAVNASTEVKWTLITTQANTGARVALAVQDISHKCDVPMSVVGCYDLI